MHRLRRFLSLERKDRHLVLEAVVRLSLARLAVAGVPFRRLASTLGRHRAESSRPPGPDQRQEVKRVAWAVDAVGMGATSLYLQSNFNLTTECGFST